VIPAWVLAVGFVVLPIVAYRLGKASAHLDMMIYAAAREPDEHDFTDVGRW
jgi:hypothetical protein